MTARRKLKDVKRLTGAEAAEVEAEEAAVVSKAVASGKTRRRDGDE